MIERRPSVLSSFATVFGGTTAAQLLGVLVLPILTRHFVPAAFGAFQVYLAILTFLTVGVGLRIELTLLRVPEADVVQTVRSLNLIVLVVALMEVAIVSGLSAFGAVPGVGHLPFPAVMLILPLFANGITQVYTYRVTRDHKFSRIVTLRLAQVLIYVAVGLVLAFTSRPAEGIIIADIAGRLGSMTAAAVLLRQEGVELIDPNSLPKLPAFLKRHRELPFVSLPGAMANTLGAAITPIMLFATYGASATGQYSLLDRSMNVPLAMIVTASSQVFIAQLSRHLRDETGQAESLYLRTAIGCLALGGLGAIVMWPFLPLLFHLVYGPGWEQAASFSRIMIFAYAMVFATGVTNQTLICLRAFRLQTCWDLLWPLSFGVAWFFIRTRHAPIREAVIVHGTMIASLGLVFLTVSAMALRNPARFASPEAGKSST